MSSPGVSPSPATNPDDSVYNNYDDNFLNYAELYTKPRDLKVDTVNSISQYANALITGKNDQYAYSDTPDLVGNRYFINTGTQCKDSDNKTHTRSVLVDNVMTSIMGNTKDSNTGLMYSLLASMQTLNSEKMFTDMSNNEPTSNSKYSPTGYLSELDDKANLPTCSKVTVYSTSKNDSDESGWVTTEDRADIDPKSVKEGFCFDTLNSIKEGLISFDPPTKPTGNTIGSLNESSKASSKEMDAISAATVKETNNSVDTAKASSDKMLKDGKSSAADFAKTTAASSTTAGNNAKNAAVAKSKADKQKTDQSNTTRMVSEYLNENPKLTFIDIMNLVINLKYTCGEQNIYRRVPAEAILNIAKGQSIQVIKNTDTERSDLVSGQNLPKEYSISSIFESIATLVDDNKYNFEKSLDLNTDLPADSFPQKNYTD